MTLYCLHRYMERHANPRMHQLLQQGVELRNVTPEYFGSGHRLNRKLYGNNRRNANLKYLKSENSRDYIKT